MAAADTRHAALSAVPGGVSGTANGKQALAAIVLSAVGLRAGVAAAAWLASGDPDVFHAPDTWSYVAPAKELLETGAYTRFGEPEVVRAPGYPLLLVPGLLLGRLEAVTLALHVAIAALTVAGTFALALQVLGDRRAALAAAALHAVDPSSIAATSLLLTETAFTACVVWGAWFLARWAREGATRELLAGTALLALAAYFRPLGYFLPFGVAG
ncbi:MAG TPA: glycosyltransferase family 39 protein, partial [Longimicrobium sp.]|nr:glycosyltransferase family 39 protein [Longimicrobium sp.]